MEPVEEVGPALGIGPAAKSALKPPRAAGLPKGLLVGGGLVAAAGETHTCGQKKIPHVSRCHQPWSQAPATAACMPSTD